MKRFILLFATWLIICNAYAQKNALSLNEQNKYIYYKVVDMPGLSADSLYKNAGDFIKAAYPKNKTVQMSNGSVTLKDKLLTRSVVTFVKHENGEVNYTLTIECKDSKYRYWLTDFVFTPYERDRYNIFVPVNGIAVPLESSSVKVAKKEMEGYQDQTGTYCLQFGEKLQQYMSENHHQKKIDKLPAKVVTDKW